jgi:hypothetical protein
MGWFGPSKDEVWRQLCDEIGAELIQGGIWNGSKVQAHVGPWTITLDTYTVSTGHTHETFTRMRAPFVNSNNFRFTLYRKGLFSGLGKLLGMQDIEVGDPEFDDAFIIKGNDEFKVRDLFSSPRIRGLLELMPQIRLDIKDDEGWFRTRFPEGVDELHFQTHGVIKDVNQLKRLYDLFAELLDQLCRIGSATKDDPGVKI